MIVGSSTAPAIRRRLAQADGITLTELLVVMVILVIVLGGLTTLFVSAMTSQVDQSNRVQAQQEARLALDALRREIHCAKAITPDTMPTGGASLISLTLGPYCANGGTTLTSALTIPAAGSYTISAANTAPFATSGTLLVGESSGTITCTGKTATSFTGCTGGSVGTHAIGTAVTANTTITWCTKDKNGAPPPGAGAPYSLWRFRGSVGTCSGTTNGRMFADYLTDTTASPAVAGGKVFVGYTPTTTGQLRALTIALPVDATPTDSRQRYMLRDDIVLRNSPRG